MVGEEIGLVNEAAAPAADETNLEATLRWAVEGQHSGVFELREPDGQETQLTLLNGEIFLGPCHPEIDVMRQAMKNPATELEGALARLATSLTASHLDSFGFRSSPDLEQCYGPVPWNLLARQMSSSEGKASPGKPAETSEAAGSMDARESTAKTARPRAPKTRTSTAKTSTTRTPKAKTATTKTATAKTRTAKTSAAKTAKAKTRTAKTSTAKARTEGARTTKSSKTEASDNPAVTRAVESVQETASEQPAAVEQESSKAKNAAPEREPAADEGGSLAPTGGDAATDRDPGALAEPETTSETIPRGSQDDPLRPPAPHPASVAIWQDQFHLSGDPFALTPDPAFLYLSDCHAEALAGLKLGLWERRGLLVMTGEVGTGKTTLLYSLLSQLGADVETAYLSNTLLSFEEILHSALTDFGARCESRQRLDLIEALNDFLEACASEGKTAALVIDEAQNLSDEVFEGLRLLLNFETYHSKLLQIVLVGQPELSDRLSSPGLRQVRDRIAVRCHLRPLSRREAKGYIEHRLETVGGSADLFTIPALGLVIRKSQGIPRRINIYCHNAMLFAYGKNLPNIRRGLVAQAIRDMDGSRSRV